ncbi:OmpA family protein [Thermomonas sp. S9]|uniref:OmpA family protein n=1 Tax=unclassified Thermomonas TaxID=2633315 RepID=UPI001AC1486F|nr:OmpA family protein [Thermomonas sp. S9]MBN8716877.1 OmpA family protein [Xanthomonadales bacterium]MBN8795116.1 OmpA family protein [Stenotrophomonas nitritireducens]MCR6496637.1 OmpA family protein [Thermomonas sp. S9]
MNMKMILRSALAVALIAGGGAFAQDAPPQQGNPSVNSIIDSLKADNAEQAPGQTRALRPGAAAMATAAPAPTVTKPAKPASINMQINFDFNSDRISGSSEQTMANLAAALTSPQLQNRNFTVIGHTDGKGSAAYNKALSDRRAEAVRRYLIDKGVSASRLRAVGKGKSELLNPADPYAAENRRVEILATGG